LSEKAVYSTGRVLSPGLSYLTERKTTPITHENPRVGQKPHGVGFGLSGFSESVCIVGISTIDLELQTITTFTLRP
jgi:hypothetical protein